MELPHYPFNYNSPYYANDTPQSKEWYKKNWTEFLGNSLIAKYTVDSIGSHIQNTSREQVQAIHETANMISQVNSEGFITIGNILALSIEESAAQHSAVIDQLDNIARIESQTLASSIEIQRTLSDMDWRFGLMREQLNATNVLLTGIDKLLRIPETQKQRHLHIEIALKCLKKVNEDSDLVTDVLENFLEAERLLPVDSFVLYQIGALYLYEQTLVDLDKALHYFKKAAKYSLIDKDDSTNSITGTERDDYYNNNQFTAKCFYQASVVSFISGDFKESYDNIERALKYSPLNNNYLLHKSKLLSLTNQIDESVNIATQIIDKDILYINTILNDISFVKHKEFTNLLQNKSKEFISNTQLNVGLINKIVLKGSQFKNEVEKLNDFPDKYVKTLSDYIKIDSIIFKNEYVLHKSINTITRYKRGVIYPFYFENGPGNLIEVIQFEKEQYNQVSKEISSMLRNINNTVFEKEIVEINNLLNFYSIGEVVKAFNLTTILLEKNADWEKKQKVIDKKQSDKLESETINKFVMVLNIVWLQFINSSKSSKQNEKANKMRAVMKEAAASQTDYVKKVVKRLFTQKFNPVQIATYNSYTKMWELNDNWIKLLEKHFKIIKANKKDEFKNFVSYLNDINGSFRTLETSTNIFGKTKYNDKDFDASLEFEEFLEHYD